MLVRGGIVTVPVLYSRSALSTPRISLAEPKLHVRVVGTSGWYCGAVGAVGGVVPGMVQAGWYREGTIPGTQPEPQIGIARAQPVAGGTVSPYRALQALLGPPHTRYGSRTRRTTLRARFHQ